MKKSIAFLAALMLTSAAWAELPSSKQRELAAAGMTEKPAKKAGPVFSKLKNPKAAPAATVGANTPVTKTAPGTDTIQYDDGTISSLPTSFGVIYGNKFNKGNSGKTITGALTLNSFQFFFMEDSVADVGLTFQVSDPLNATSITARASVNMTPLANSGQSFSNPTLNTIAATAFGTTFNNVFSSTLYLGAWCLNAATTFPVDNETLGLSDNMIVEGGGFQGFTASSGTGARTFSDQSFNAVLRANVTGNVVPVELMAFEVE